jgi:ornithine cyclodeaminase/alanine dehydrogenase-like protein (mu-crystallin family)
VLLLSRTEVEELLDVDELIDALAGAMADLSAGRASAPNRVGARVEERNGLLAAMPGYTPSAGALGASSSRCSRVTPVARCPRTRP